jgi:hypothetical protein
VGFDQAGTHLPSSDSVGAESFVTRADTLMVCTGVLDAPATRSSSTWILTTLGKEVVPEPPDELDVVEEVEEVPEVNAATACVPVRVVTPPDPSGRVMTKFVTWACTRGSGQSGMSEGQTKAAAVLVLVLPGLYAVALLHNIYTQHTLALHHVCPCQHASVGYT